MALSRDNYCVGLEVHMRQIVMVNVDIPQADVHRQIQSPQIVVRAIQILKRGVAAEV